jgi:tRNA G18 (ribose-2'-O)-methylase SpoU
MAIQLFKKGSSHTVNGKKCQMKVFDEHSYLHMLKEGWCYSIEECYQEKKQDKPKKGRAAVTPALKKKPVKVEPEPESKKLETDVTCEKGKVMKKAAQAEPVEPPAKPIT